MARRTFDPKFLPITSAVATALLAGACSPSRDVANADVAVCRDAAGLRTDDAKCVRSGGGHGGGGAAWYFLSRGSVVPQPGQAVAGGYTTPRAGVGYARASSATVSRGGFGMSARGFGGGVGE
ncbi:hypothetical protein [Sphingomonas sp.]|jgi:hypothetical protein|uniref:hypothetical protein n=1 Tax=Sphingomonas sp. TaxID=28214 RepID=UPI0035623CD8